MSWTRGAVALAIAAVAVSVVATASSCSSFSSDATELAESGTADGAVVPSLDASTADVNVADPDSGSSPCLGGGGKIYFSSTFDSPGGPTLVGWMGGGETAGQPPVAAVATDAGGVARASIVDAKEGPAYATIFHALPTSMAGRFSFSMSPLAKTLIVHQTSQASGDNLRLSLQESGWQLGIGGDMVNLGPAGSAGATHTITYRVDQSDSGAHVVATFDGTDLAFDFTGPASFQAFQLGPFWATDDPAPAVTVDYDDVTIWDCTP